ncbi:unnamed protein product [Ixodes persulcatus]
MAAAGSTAILMGKCISSAMKKSVRVVVPRFVLNTYLMAHYKERTEYDVFDANEECKPGDWVIIRELPERLSLKIAHKVEKIVFKDGNIIDPLTGQKCMFTDYVKDVDRESEVFGLAPPYKSLSEPKEQAKLSDK